MKRVLACLLALALAVGAARLAAQPAALPAAAEPFTVTPPRPAPAQPEETPLVGLWVPYFSLTPAQPTESAFTENFRAIAQAAAEKGVNALFVHVRPFCDALYPSALYPWSHILTGTQGKAPGYDPLAVMVEITHGLGMEFHAWINPLRVQSAAADFSLSPDNPYALYGQDHPEYFMAAENGLWLDPAWPAVRGMIARGAAEIVENYAVDGIHFDDYFYPSQDPDLDREAYSLYIANTAEPLPQADWRRVNVSALLNQVWLAVHRADPAAVFGVAPQGNLRNDLDMGADVAAWCAAPGYVDYLCPQLYYSFDNPALGYGEALAQWLALPRFDGLKLYAGLALYKVGTDADGGTWLDHGDVIAAQIADAQAAQCGGVVLYAADQLDRYAPP